jgi:hypothetical protein
MEMTTQPTKLASPMDVMYLLHKALRAEAWRVERVIDQLDEGSSLLARMQERCPRLGSPGLLRGTH